MPPSKNNLILSSFLCDYDIKKASQDFAKLHGVTFGRLINRSLQEYLKNHNGDVVEVREVKAKVLKCTFGHCTEKAETTGVFKKTNKTYRLCSIHASLFSKDNQLKKEWELAKT